MTLASSADKPSKTFDELMSTPINFFAYIINGLKITNLNQETLLWLTFKLLKGTHTNFTEPEYDIKAYYTALSEKLDWENPKRDDVADFAIALRMFTRSLVIQKRVEDLQLGVESYQKQINEGDFPRIQINDIEDMLLLVVQNRLTNLSGDDVADFAIALRMFTRSLVIQKRVEDLQLGVESYQKQINVTKPDTTRPDLKKRHPQNWRDLPRDIRLDSVVDLRYEKRSKSENKGKLPTEMELVLEQTQQGLGVDNSKASTSGTKIMSFIGSSAENATDKSTIIRDRSTLPGSVCLRTCLEPDEWIKDSGCSKHMTGNKSLFSIYKAYDGDNVVFGSNLNGKIIGKGELNFFLGLQIKQMEYGIFFNQSKYVKETLKKFGLEDSKPTKTPMSTEIKLTKDDEADSVDRSKYQ
nr:retrovirus-related Pol polyprotein from transposon TNT 1-94 [Tanacetum cinerariifolium]